MRTKWRDEEKVREALRQVRRARTPKALTQPVGGAFDKALADAANAGAEFREIADAAKLSLGVVHKRAIRYREQNGGKP